MIITDLNRHGGIGANSLYIEIGGFRILIDAGIHPKKAGYDSLPHLKTIPPDSLDLIILTHCHLDHMGALPLASRRHPRARILMSLPSQYLFPRMMHNSVNVMKKQRDELDLPELPLYTHSEIDTLEHLVFPMLYGQTKAFEAANGDEIAITFHCAGHVCGAAGVEFAHGGKRIFFTGDVLFTEQRILPGASFPERPFDILVMETTRGHTDRPAHITRETEVARLFDTINKTLDRGGSVLLPVFALGRMQEILTLLSDARRENRLEDCPVYVAGLGMVIADEFDRIRKKTGLVRFTRDAFKHLKTRPLPRNMKAGRTPAEPSIFLLSSGMVVEKTPSYKAAASILGDAASTVCFVGYCDPDTPGGKILATGRGERFVFEGLDFICRLNASIERFDLTGHADRDELLDYSRRVDAGKIVLTHGDPDARQWFIEQYAATKNGTPKIVNPEPLQAYTLV